TPAGIGKSEQVQNSIVSVDEVRAALGDLSHTWKATPPDAALKADPEEAGLFMDADIYKGFKKMRKKLGKKVLSGSMTVDEARAKLGRQFAQKSGSEEAVQKSAEPTVAVNAGTDLSAEQVGELTERIRASLLKQADR